MYKQPNVTQDKLNELADKFISGTSVEQLPQARADQARNVTAGIFVLSQDHVNVTYSLSPAVSAGSSGEPGGGGAVTPSGGNQTIKYPVSTTDQGDIDGFVQLNNDGLTPGNTSTEVQRLAVYTEGATEGNATSYLVPNKGLTVISDIDDILRVTQIWKPEPGLINNTFVNPFQAWRNMPDIYANWSRSIPGVHFHYLTTTPEQITRPYMDFIFKTYPGGSFDTRPLNFSDVSATLSIRKFLLEKIFQTFPERKFILVADTSNPDVMSDYPAMATEFPGQVQCILLRNTSSTDPSMWFPYNTKGFKDLNQQTYMFFNTPVSILSQLFLSLTTRMLLLYIPTLTFFHRTTSRILTSQAATASTPRSSKMYSLSIRTHPLTVTVPGLEVSARVVGGFLPWALRSLAWLYHSSCKFNEGVGVDYSCQSVM